MCPLNVPRNLPRTVRRDVSCNRAPYRALYTCPVTCPINVPRKRAPYCALCGAPCRTLEHRNETLPRGAARCPVILYCKPARKPPKLAGTYIGHDYRASFRPCFVTCAPNTIKTPLCCKVPNSLALITVGMSKSGTPPLGFVLHSFAQKRFPIVRHQHGGCAPTTTTTTCCARKEPIAIVGFDEKIVRLPCLKQGVTKNPNWKRHHQNMTKSIMCVDGGNSRGVKGPANKAMPNF